ncbi:MAG: YceI family protein [Armatimonadetes bacterium]|nr:YceI family protein [Armatimonadota bacterium]
MAKWFLEPGHTAAEFCVRHMMVADVCGYFKNVHGRLEFDEATPERASVEVVIPTQGLWTGEPDRDHHLKSPDFFDVEKHTAITFKSKEVRVISPHEYTVTGDLTIRGITRLADLNVQYLGQWETPWWEEGVDKGPVCRAGFRATTTINRHDFGVSWNVPLPGGGVVVGDQVRIRIDVEAVRGERIAPPALPPELQSALMP